MEGKSTFEIVKLVRRDLWWGLWDMLSSLEAVSSE